MGRYDAVTYLKYLDTLRVSESFRSVWIFAESSYKIFEFAKKRVYRFVTSGGVNLSDQSKSLKGKKRKLKGDDAKEQGAELSLLFCCSFLSLFFHFFLNFYFICICSCWWHFIDQCSFRGSFRGGTKVEGLTCE